MLQIKYLGTTKEVFSEWGELTIEDFHGLYQVIYKYEDIDLETDDANKLLFLREYTSFILQEKMDKVNAMDIKDVEHLVASTENLLSEYKRKNIRKFKLENEWYFFPVDNLRKATFGEYIETTQLEINSKLLKNGKFDIVAEQMARLCKKAGEMNKYLEEDEILKRADKFKKLTMDVVWEFCFFLFNQQIVLQKIIPTYGAEENQAWKQSVPVKFLNHMDG